MSRPRRSTRQEFYDVFDSFDVKDQETVLEFLAEIHRMAKRRAAKEKPEAPAQLNLREGEQ